MAGSRKIRHVGYRLVVLFAMGTVLTPQVLQADVVGLSIFQPISATAGGIGSFDVLLTDLSGTTGVTVGGFNFELQTSSGDVTLASANTSTVSPYIFSGNSFSDTYFSGSITIQTSPDLIASDSVLIPFSGTPLSAGETVALGSVLFDVAPRAPTETVQVNFGGSTNLSDPNGNPIPIGALTGGDIDITAATTAATPEPSTWPGFFAAGLLLYRRYRRGLATGG